MPSYFRQIPNFEYISRTQDEQNISDYVTVKNLFKRGKLREDIFQNISFFEKYSIIGDERPDQVAYKFYKDETLDWIILLSNNILNLQSEWPLSQVTFEKVMLEKYGSYEELYSGISHYETVEIKNSLGLTVVNEGIKIQPGWKTNGNFIEVINTKIANISCGEQGDGLTPSSTIYVYMLEGILGLKVGDQVTIENVSEPQYNGKHVVKDILDYDENIITSFTYELPFIPNVTQPTLAYPRKEEVNYTVPELSANPGNSYYYEFWDPGIQYTVQIPSAELISPVTNYDYELQLEEKKRQIYILKPRYLGIIYNDMEQIMTYKKGSQQYVSGNLKRASNIRLHV